VADNRPDLLAVYKEICSRHDGIETFRAQLLALLPIASGAGIFLLVGRDAPNQQVLPYLLPVGVLGALITLGLFIYELGGFHTCHSLRMCAEVLEGKLLADAKLLPFGPFRFWPDAVRLVEFKGRQQSGSSSGSGQSGSGNVLDVGPKEARSSGEPEENILGVGPKLAALIIYPAITGGWAYVAGVGLVAALRLIFNPNISITTLGSKSLTILAVLQVVLPIVLAVVTIIAVFYWGLTVILRQIKKVKTKYEDARKIVSLSAHWDGKHVVLDEHERHNLEANAKLIVTVVPKQ
jgi:hypothetical protein